MFFNGKGFFMAGGRRMNESERRAQADRTRSARLRAKATFMPEERGSGVRLVEEAAPDPKKTEAA